MSAVQLAAVFDTPQARQRVKQSCCYCYKRIIVVVVVVFVLVVALLAMPPPVVAEPQLDLYTSASLQLRSCVLSVLGVQRKYVKFRCLDPTIHSCFPGQERCHTVVVCTVYSTLLCLCSHY